jgi:hypothetical protein
MKKAQGSEGRSLFAMPQEMRPAMSTPREPTTAKRVAKDAGVLGKGAPAVPASKRKAPAKIKRNRRLNGLR